MGSARRRLPRARPLGAASLSVMLASLLLPWTAQAAAFVDLFNNFPDSISTDVANDTTWIATPFVPTVSGTAKLVSVFTQCTSDGNNCYPGLATVSIFSDSNGQPGSAIETSGTYQPGRDAPTKADCLVMPSPVALTAGTHYWAVLKGTTSNYQNWHKGTTNAVSVNTMRTTNSGATWTSINGNNFGIPFSLRVDDGDHCVGHLVPNPDGGVEIGAMFPQSGKQDVNTITIGNDGLADLTVSHYTITGTNPSVFSLMDENPKDSPTAKVIDQNTPFAVAPNGLRILYVVCTGPATDGHYVADLTLYTDDPDNPSITWPLSCYVDNTPPTLYVTPNPDGSNGWYKTLPADISTFGDDGAHGSGTNFISCDVNGSFFFSENFSSTATVHVTVPPAFEGLAVDSSENEISCTAHDVAGNVTPTPTTATFKIDSHPPVISADIAPAPNGAGWNNTDVTVSFSCADPVPGSGLDTNTVGGGGTYTAETGGTDVSNTGACQDFAGNVGPTEMVTLKIDKTTPTTQIVSGPDARTGSTTANFELGGSDALSGIASYVCQLDGNAVTPCGSATPSFSGLPDGDHTLHAWAIDGAGNQDAIGASYSWYVDTSVPTVVFDSPADGAMTKASDSVTFHGADIDDTTFTFKCQLDGGSNDPCTSPYDYTSLSGGGHVLAVAATDVVGNTGFQSLLHFTVDAVPPDVTIDQSVFQDDPTSLSPIRFFVVFSEPVNGFGDDTSDVTLSGTAGATTVQVLPILGSLGTEFYVLVSGMTQNGTVIADIPAGAATDVAGNPNNASTSVDNSVTFAGLNTPPVAANDTGSTSEDHPLVVSAPGVLGNDTDADGDPLTAALVSGPSHGSLTLNADGSFTYTPNANYNGSDSFTYKANDGTADSNVATVTLSITPVNDPPVATNDSSSMAEDTALVVAAPGVLGNDTDVEGDPLTAVLVSGPSHGLLTLNANGSFTYTPGANYNGSDSFTYKANDGTANSNVATVSLTITAVNDAPVVAVSAGGSCDPVLASGTMNLSVTDVDSPIGAVTLTATSSDRHLVPSANIVIAGAGSIRTVTITAVPIPNNRTATITLTASDGAAASTTTITVMVAGGRNAAVNGTSGADMIFALSGTNTINGNAGDDLICGGTGADTINGGDGDDTIDGRGGNDVLLGGNGNDILRGSGGNDTLTGGAGADFFSGGPGTDVAVDFNAIQGDTQDGTIP